MSQDRAGTGRTSFKHALETPALLVDLDVVDANIAHIAATCRAAGVGWRPHMKGHKTPEIAHLQIAAGAIGVTCAKLGEAEVMAAAGIKSILIANQIVSPGKLERLISLAATAEVIVAIDDPANARALAAAAARRGVTLCCVIEVDIGMRRAGVAPGAPVLALADQVAGLRGIDLVGVMGWESHAVLIADPARKAETVAHAIRLLVDSAHACRDRGHAMPVVSCGGTGTFPLCVARPGVTEIQAGGGTVSDLHYRDHYHVPLPPALTVLASVTSRPTPHRIVLDAGRKAMSAEAAMPCPIGLPDIREIRLSAEHATIDLESPSDVPALGAQVEFMVGSSDATVHLHDRMFAVRGERVVDTWSVAARGRIT